MAEGATDGTGASGTTRSGRWVTPPSVELVMKRYRLTVEQYNRLVAVAARYDVPTLDLAASGKFWLKAEDAVRLEELASRMAAHQADIDARLQARQEDSVRRKENAARRRAHLAAATHRRPRQQGTRRTRVVTIRLSDEEYETLARKAQQLQISMSAYLVQAGVGRRIRAASNASSQPPGEVPRDALVALEQGACEPRLEGKRRSTPATPPVPPEPHAARGSRERHDIAATFTGQGSETPNEPSGTQLDWDLGDPRSPRTKKL